MKITGAMKTNVPKLNMPERAPHFRHSDISSKTCPQPTDVMVYVLGHGARRVFHCPRRGFIVKYEKRMIEVNIMHVMQILAGSTHVVLYNRKTWKR